MNSNARVLVVGRDEMLLRTRLMILGAFFEVKGAGRSSEAVPLIQNDAFDLVVLCHSLTNAECEQLAALAHDQNPRTRILAMSASGNASKPWADKQLGVDAGPYGLLKKCAAMLGLVLKNRAKTAQVEGPLTPVSDVAEG
jgi:DNA-binding NtrC family response regulator